MRNWIKSASIDDLLDWNMQYGDSQAGFYPGSKKSRARVRARIKEITGKYPPIGGRGLIRVLVPGWRPTGKSAY